MSKEDDGTQRELDKIMWETGVFEKGDSRYSPILAWRVLLGILSLFGVAIVMKLISLIGL